MKRNFDKVLTTFEGEEMKIAENKMATARVVIDDALLAEDPKMSGTEKMKNFVLAEKVHKTPNGESVELSTEELTIIKNSVGKIYKPLVVGQVYRIIEGEE